METLPKSLKLDAASAADFVSNYLNDIERQLREQRKQRIFDMWLACATQSEIAEAVDITRDQAQNATEEMCNLDAVSKIHKSLATFSDPDFVPPLFNVWTFANSPVLCQILRAALNLTK